MYSKKKIIKYLILIVAILILLIILLTQLSDIGAIINIFKTNFKPVWLIVCLLLVLVYAIIHRISLMILVKIKYKELSLFDLYLISGSEFFFNAVTPFSTGGQPFQAYALSQKKVKISDSTSQLLLNFLAYQTSINIISIVFVFIYFNRLHSDIENFIILFIIGFSINIVVMILILLVGLNKHFGNLLIKLISAICKIKIINKFTGDKTDAITMYVNDMQSAFREIGKNFFIWFICLITRSIANLIYYAIPFIGFMIIDYPLSFENFFYAMALTSFALTTTIWVPIPGAAIGVELVFNVMFKQMIIQQYPDLDAANIVSSGMLIWRFMTYYLLMFVGLINYLIFDKRISKEMKKEINLE